MEKTTWFFYLSLILILATAPPVVRAGDLRISSPPLVSGSFDENTSAGRCELVYFGFEEIEGYGLRWVWRKAQAANFALTTNTDVYYMDGSQTYDISGSPAYHELDYYVFASGGITGELQYRPAGVVNLILFAGPRVHYGQSEDELTYEGSTSGQANNDLGYGGEVGLQLSLRLKKLNLIPFLSYDRLEVSSSSTAEDVADEELTFENKILGFDLYHRDYRWTLSGLVSQRDAGEADELDDLVLLKLGRSF